MNPFRYARPEQTAAAIRQVGDDPKAAFLAGGTSLIDLMRLNVEAPAALVDVNPLPLGKIEAAGDGVRIGAMVRNSDLAYHELIRGRFPVLSEALLSGASPQLRNMATVGGNLLQRTRCWYFRDTSAPCNKREPGSGCSALEGYNRTHAVLGASEKCIATHPSDMCVALVALDAVVKTQGPKGERSIDIQDFHLSPGDAPERETVLEHGELITAVELPSRPFAARSCYVKARDRASYEFALASAAVALEVKDGVVRSARVALGGVATKPWRSAEAEKALVGQKAEGAVFRAAAGAALKDARPRKYNAFKVELARRVIVRALEAAAALPEPGERIEPMSLEPIGKPVDRVDGRLKVTGSAVYAAEYSPKGVVHGVLVPGTITKGRIADMDTRAAEKAPGVLAVLTHRNAPRIKPPPAKNPRSTGDQSPANDLMLQDDRVHFFGQHIAMVIADTLDQARHAASLIKVKYEPDRALTDFDAELKRAAPPKEPVQGKPPDTSRGDPEKGLADADVKIDATYTTPVENHNPMEPHATVAVWDGDHLTVYDATQYVSGVRETLAYALDMPRANVRVVSRFIGGAFGCKGMTWPHVTLAAAAARYVGRPVKVVLTRQQMFTSVGYRPRTVQRLRLGATKDGKLTAMIHDGTSQTSLINEFVEPVVFITRMMYASPGTATTTRVVRLETNSPTYMRAPGEATGSYALESAMDELAYALKIDPIELRLRNHADADPEDGRPWSSKSLKECYRVAAGRFGWKDRNPEPRSMRDGGALVGWGMASATYPMNRRPASALARVFDDGSAAVEVGSHDLGTGAYTVLTQVAADVLGLPVDKVRCELGDTDLPPASVSGGSSTTASAGSAVQAAAQAVRDKLIALAVGDPASPLHGLKADGVVVGAGRLFAREEPARGETFVELLRRGAKEEVHAVADSASGEEQKKFSMHSFGAVFAEVRVDPALGEVRVRRLVGAYAAGRILNAKTARSQFMGGMIFGMGMALLENTFTEPQTGRIVTRELEDYLLPVNADAPSVEPILVTEDDPHVNPIGVKGVGEIGNVGTAAAIANAVYHATGKRVRDLPITLDKLL